MRKKYYYLFIIVIAFHTLFYPFLGIEAKESKEQPDVCSGPSKTMSLYFQFQNEMMSAMLWSDINERRFVTTKTDGWLFKEKFLTLGTGSINALDMIATNIRWNMQAAWSSVITLTVLLSLAEASVLQSNTEWLWILTKDRVIVREYKQLLAIESSLMELAYFLSQRISLITKFEWNLLKNVTSVIEKYQELWLLKKTSTDTLNWSTLADIMTELVEMNAYMKHFVLFNAWLGGFEPTLLPQFDKKAIENLKHDYSWLWVFWVCNEYASSFENNITKWMRNGEEAPENSMNDLKMAAKRLKSAFTFSKWKNWSEKSNRCDMSEYEMAQLRAYRWWNWTCKTWFINGNVASTIQKLSREKKAQQKKKEKTTKLSKEERIKLKYQKKIEKIENKIAKIRNEIEEIEKEKEKIEKETEEKIQKIEKDTADEIYLMRLQREISDAKDIAKQKQIWRDTFWTGVLFNMEYSGWFNIDLVEMYSDLMDNYEQTHANAISSDLSYELKNIKALLDQVEDTSKKMDDLKNTLKDIAKYQCHN